jgi:hypothetical protein
MRAWLIGGGGRERLAAHSLQIPQVAKLDLPAPIDRQTRGEPRGVVERTEQLLHEQRQPLRWLEPASRVQHRRPPH